MVAVVPAEVESARRVIDMRDPQLLAGHRPVRKTGREKVSRGFVAGEDCGGFGTLNLHGQAG